MMYIQSVYTPLFNPGHILLMWPHIPMYDEKNNYQEMYEQCVANSLEKLASNLGNYEMKETPGKIKISDFPVLNTNNDRYIW